MTQKRNIEFGVGVTAEGVQDIVGNLSEPGLLSGGAITVATATTITVAPLAAILTTGLLLVEDAPQTVTIANTSAAVDYTIFYTHSAVKTVGGEAARLNVSTGLFTASQVGGTIVMWVQYPGGSIPLAANMISQPRRFQIGPGVENKRDEVLVAPFASKWVNDPAESSGSTITITDKWDSTENRVILELENAGAGIGDITQLIPFIVRDLPPTKMFIDLKMGTLSSIRISLIDTNGIEHSPSNDLINTILFNNESVFVEASIIFPVSFVSTVTTLGEEFALKFFISLNPAKKMQIGSISLTTNADPV